MRLLCCLLICSTCLAAESGLDQAAQEALYRQVFGQQDDAARSTSARERLALELYRRMDEPIFADIHPYLRERIADLLDGNRDPTALDIRLSLLEQAIEEEAYYRRDLRLRHLDLLTDRLRVVERQQRPEVVAAMASQRAAMARQERRQGDLRQAADDNDELADILKAMGDREGARQAARLEDWLEDRADTIAEQLADDAKADDPEDHEDSARVWLLIGDTERAAAQARLGGTGPASRFAEAVWASRRWNQTLLAPGWASSDITALRRSVDGAGRQRTAELLGYCCAVGPLFDQARALQLQVLDESVPWSELHGPILALCAAADALAEASDQRVGMDAARLAAALDAADQLLASRLDEPEEAAVLEQALILCSTIAEQAGSLDGSLPMLTAVREEAWAARLAAIAYAPPDSVAVAGQGGVAASRLLRMGWQAIYDHQRNPLLGKAAADIEAGTLLLRPGGRGGYRLDTSLYDQLMLQLDTSRVPEAGRRIRYTITWSAGPGAIIRVVSRGPGLVGITADHGHELGTMQVDEQDLQINFHWDDATRSATVMIDGEESDPLQLINRPTQLLMNFNGGPPKRNTTVAIENILGRPIAE